MTRTERLWRLKSALKARCPYTCPACSSGAIHPTFWPGLSLLWACANCGGTFSEGD